MPEELGPESPRLDGLTGYPEEGAPLVETILKTLADGSCWQYFQHLKEKALKTATTEDDWWSFRTLKMLEDHKDVLYLKKIEGATVRRVAILAMRFSIPTGSITEAQ